MNHVDGAKRATYDLWPDIGKALGLSKNSIYQAARRGVIPGLIKIGARWLVKREVFDAWMMGRDNPKAAAAFPPGMETR